MSALPEEPGKHWKRTNVFDPDSGEVHTGMTLVPDYKPPTTRYSDTFIPVFTDGWQALVDAKLTGSQARLFFLIVSRSPHDGEPWDAAPLTLAPLLGWDRWRVTHELRVLEQKGLIRRPAAGKVAFNPLIAWHGKAEGREAAKTALKEES